MPLRYGGSISLDARTSAADDIVTALALSRHAPAVLTQDEAVRLADLLLGGLLRPALAYLDGVLRDEDAWPEVQALLDRAGEVQP